ncbi:hypothetical protein [Methylacidimicrobium cyclopophantes]|nr:hypothetical protein [Methylacidimicrobium cyclopophantes]
MSVRIVGAGSAGINVLDEWILLSDSPEGSFACDGELSAVEGSLAGEKLLLAPNLVGGLGCFGSRDLAWRMVGQENQRLESLLTGCSSLLILTGLAGATGATVAEALSLKSVEREIPTAIFAFLPFPFEAEERRKAAEIARDEFPAEASLFLFSTAPVVQNGSTPGVADVRRRLRDLQAGVGQWVDLWREIASGGVRSVSLEGGADSSPFSAGRRVEDCRVFWEKGPRADGSPLALFERSDFRQAAESADYCVGYFETDEEIFGMQDEAREKLAQLLPRGTPVCVLGRSPARPMRNHGLFLFGRCVSRLQKQDLSEEARNEPMRTSSELPVEAAVGVQREGRRVSFPAESAPFAKTTATMHKGENLDIPAFRRRSGSRFAGE